MTEYTTKTILQNHFIIKTECQVTNAIFSTFQRRTERVVKATGTKTPKEVYRKKKASF